MILQLLFRERPHGDSGSCLSLVHLTRHVRKFHGCLHAAGKLSTVLPVVSDRIAFKGVGGDF
jgi:hypothetical protein